MEERRTHSRREADSCPYQLEIVELDRQSKRIEDFIRDAEPLLAFIRIEMQSKKEKSLFLQRVSEKILGGAILAIFGIIGSWVLDKLKIDLFVGK
jgi:hypothetical protein